MTEQEIQDLILGSVVEDIYSRYRGTATAYTRWLTGCARVHVESFEMKDGKLTQGEWFDVNRLKIVEAKDIQTVDHHSAGATPTTPDKGGPQDDPSPERPVDPGR